VKTLGFAMIKKFLAENVNRVETATAITVDEALSIFR
jgi:hypothetical protein